MSQLDIENRRKIDACNRGNATAGVIILIGWFLFAIVVSVVAAVVMH